MKKLMCMLFVLPILIFGGANQAVDSTAWDTVGIYPTSPYALRQQGYEYVNLFREIDIDSAGTTMVWTPMETGMFNCFSLDIPAQGDSLKTEYFPGIQLADITDYPYRWQVKTANTGTDSTYRVSGFSCDPFFTYVWFRFINLQLVDKTDIPIYLSGKEQ